MDISRKSELVSNDIRITKLVLKYGKEVLTMGKSTARDRLIMKNH